MFQPTGSQSDPFIRGETSANVDLEHDREYLKDLALDFSLQIPEAFHKKVDTLKNDEEIRAFLERPLRANDYLGVFAPYGCIFHALLSTQEGTAGKFLAFANRIGINFDKEYSYHDQEFLLRQILNELGKTCRLNTLGLIQGVVLGTEMMETVLKLGANPNHIHRQGFTALHIAEFYNDHGAVEILLQGGADPEIPPPKWLKARMIYGASLKELKRAGREQFLLDLKARELAALLSGGVRGSESLYTPSFVIIDRALHDIGDSSFRWIAVLEHPDSSKLLSSISDRFISSNARHQIVEAFLKYKPFAVSDRGLTLLGEVLISGDWELYSRVSLGIKTLTPDPDKVYFLRHQREPINQKELLRKTHKILRKLQDHLDPKELLDGFSKLFKLLRSPYQLYLYVDALDKLRFRANWDEGISFYQVASNLLFFDAAERPLKPFSEQIPIRDVPLSGSEIEPDILLLLNEPGKPVSPDPAKNPLWEHFPRVFPEKEHHEHAWNLARIGCLTYSFSRFRFAAKRIIELTEEGKKIVLLPAPLEALGGQYFPATGEYPHWSDQFGPQYLFKKGTLKFTYETARPTGMEKRRFDKDTTIILRQGYYIVHNPKVGMLLIRNSSPEFGRNLLNNTAIYSPAPNASIPDLLRPTNRFLAEGFNPIDCAVTSEVEAIDFLLNELKGFMDYARSWTFDTTFKNKNRFRGLPHILKHLSYLSQEAAARGSSLALGFVHPDYPAYRQYTYHDEEGVLRRMLPVDGSVIKQLERFAKKPSLKPHRLSATVRNFIQEAGIDNAAELTIFEI